MKRLKAKLRSFLPLIGSKISLSSIADRFRTLLRTLSLSASTFRRSRKDERPKVLLQSSPWLALARCTVHLTPAFVSISLVAINLVGLFLGSELQGPQDQDDLKMGLLQIAAKVQELLVVASVGAVIFHILRSELVFGEGVPLGLLVSGWNFSQLQYLWSAEFLGGSRCNTTMTRKERWKRRGICLFIAMGGALALLAGPAAALLMIPRQMDWPVGGGIYWLNGSDEQLWPTNLDADFYSDMNCSHEAQFYDNRCPGAGFAPLHQYFSTWWNHLNTGFSFELRDWRIRKMIYARPSLRAEANTWAFTAHAATATLQDAMRGLHSDALGFLHDSHPQISPYPEYLMWADPIRFQVETKVPAVRVFCQPKGMVWLWGENLTVEFPSINEFDEWWGIPSEYPEEKSLKLPKMKTLDVLEFIQEDLAGRGLLENSSSLLNGEIFQNGRRTLIFPVDTESTGNSLDLVVLLGATWNSSVEIPPSNVLSCSIDARWVKAHTVMEMRSNNQLSHEYHLGRVQNLIETKSHALERTLGYVRFKPPTDGSWPRIRLHSSWYKMLAPTLPNEPLNGLPWLTKLGSNQTTLEALFDMIYNPLESTLEGFETVIATAVADGLSRSGLIPNYNGSRFLEAWPFTEWTVENDDLARTMVRQGDPIESFPAPSDLKPNLTRMVMKATYRGYVMQAIGWFDYLSIAALLFHAAIAFVHSCLLFCSRPTSGAWDTILELLTLTHQSEPPTEPLLANTSAGVASFKTVKLVAYDDLRPGGELQLRLRGPAQSRNPFLKPDRIGQAYGSTSTAVGGFGG
ncbi:hypothetical protein EDB80DRAFT_762470 [Ilyonectria destructans]|nr:hypothetical protein EDB80DRAFT_762470 [Ilyonectria destructans]